MRLLYLLQTFPKISQKFVLDEMIAVESHGHSIQVIAVRDSNETMAHKEAARFSVSYFEDLQLRGVVEFVKHHNIDHIHSHFASDVVGIAHRVHQATGVPFSFTTHAFDLYKRVHPDLGHWCADAKCVFTISEHNRQHMCRVLGVDDRKIVVVRCGVFPERLEPLDYSPQPFKIITACRFVEKKGLDLLVTACKELKKRGIKFICEIVGNGSNRIAHQIEQSGLSEQIVLKGSMVHPEIVDFFRTGSVFVLPCIQAADGDMDGIPVALIEAMALRIPVISTNLSGIPELVSNRQNGLLVSPGNVDELVDAIIEIKDDPLLVARIRNCSRERILQSYNSMANAKKMITALRFDHPQLDDFDLPPIQFCEENETDVADLRFEGLSNVFNPSFYMTDDLKILTFRAIPDGDDRLTSYVVVQNVMTNISADCLSLGCLQLIDPRVFQVNDEFWVTFNSGHVASGNDIFVMKVHPQLEEPKRVVFNARQSQERNWSFFSRDGEIYALYWICPLKILRLKQETHSTWEFEEYFSEQPATLSGLSNVTIGTQLAEHDGKYYFMGHGKHIVKGKKLYLGRSCCLDFDNRSVSYGKRWFAYSKQSLHGDQTKHNNNLFSCTYFSGIQIVDGKVLLGYGINDVDYGFSKYSLCEFMGDDMVIKA